MKSLSIVIPAFNEEEAILSIIQRTRDSVDRIKEALAFDFVEIIVVDDGSRDRTAELAASQPGVTLITYKNNRGYGSAIKTGFDLAEGDIVGFLDADGTCDPLFFRELCRPVIEDKADVVLGNRLTQTSRMPLLRKLGNRIFAAILRFLAGEVVSDTASGMRVIRRDKLPLLYPLPDGMHFTPAMSSKALFDPDIRISEIDMHYEERIGESKLKVLQDGLRFLGIIIQTAFAYRPLFIYNIFTLLFTVVATLYLYAPLSYYLRYRRIEDYMYYRLSSIVIMGIIATFTFHIGYINHHITRMRKRSRPIRENRIIRYSGLVGVVLILAAVILTHKGWISYILYRKVYIHWVYILTGEFLSVLGLIFIFSYVIHQTIDFILQINLSRVPERKSTGEFETRYRCRVIRKSG